MPSNKNSNVTMQPQDLQELYEVTNPSAPEWRVYVNDGLVWAECLDISADREERAWAVDLGSLLEPQVLA